MAANWIVALLGFLAPLLGLAQSDCAPTREALAKLREAASFSDQHYWLRELSDRGCRLTEAQPVLEALQKNFPERYPDDDWQEAWVTTTTDMPLLSLFLLDPQALFSTPAVRERVLGDLGKWARVPLRLYRCAADGMKTSSDNLADSLEIVDPSDLPILDDLETRNHCLHALGKFPSVETLRYLETVIEAHPRYLGSDTTRVLRGMLIRALSDPSQTEIVAETNAILLRILESRKYRRRSQHTVLRFNAAMALSIPGNRAIAGALQELEARERDPDVRKFLVQGKKLIQQASF